MSSQGAAALDLAFSALANEPRRRIVVSLSEGSATIRELRRDFEFSKQAMSRHVAVLERAGLVERAVRGRSHHLSLVRDPLDSVTEWVRARRVAWESSLSRLGAVLEETEADP